jgi:alkaline phosphatase D
MQIRRRQLLQLALATGVAPAFVRHARGSDAPRFSLGIASGHPRPDGMVLWTRLSGDDLPARVPVRWEVAEDQAFTRVVARGEEAAEAAWAHSVHAEPSGLRSDRWYWYRFSALGQQSAPGRTRTAPAPDADAASLRFAITSCQRWDHGHYAAWRHVADDELDLVMFLGDYIYEYPGIPSRVRTHRGGETTTLEQYRDRYAQYKSDPALQAAHAAAPWLLVWDDHEVENDYAGLHGNAPGQDFPARRTAAYQAYWEHQPFPKAWRPQGTDGRVYGRYDWGRLARIHALDDRQYRDPQACPKPGRGGSNTVTLKSCPELLDPKRTLLGAAQERWLAEGWDPQRGWNLVAQQTLMARLTWTDPAQSPTYWTDGWDGYAPARNRLLADMRERKPGNVVVLGGDVHSHYVADLKADFDDPASPVVATEFCGSSISSRSIEQSRLDAALPWNPHIRYGRSDQRGYMRFALQRDLLQAQIMVVENIEDPASVVRTAARFVVEAGRPGAVPA